MEIIASQIKVKGKTLLEEFRLRIPVKSCSECPSRIGKGRCKMAKICLKRFRIKYTLEYKRNPIRHLEFKPFSLKW